MVRTKTVARKAGGGTVSGGFPTPTQPVLTQDVEAEVARATEAAQHVARLRAMLDGDGSEDGDDDEAVVVSSRPNAPKAKRSRSQTKGKEEKEVFVDSYLAYEAQLVERAAAKKKKKKKRPTAQPVDDEEGDQDTGGQPAIDAIDAGTMTVDASAIPPALQWEVGASGIASTQLRSFDEEVASSTGTDQVCSLPVSCLCLRLLLCV
jgi:hypothetical protein